MRLLSALLPVLLFTLVPKRAGAQALATATGPGTSVSVGGCISGFETDYGKNRIGGLFAFVDVQLHWRVGLEGEARFLRWHAQQQVTEASYLGGLRVIVWPRPRRFLPYAKFLAGAGKITLPYGYAHGDFLAYAPGAGLDITLNDAMAVRVVDFEYQRWPQFDHGELSPYCVSFGLSVRLNPVSHYPKGARARH